MKENLTRPKPETRVVSGNLITDHYIQVSGENSGGQVKIDYNRFRSKQVLGEFRLVSRKI